MMSGSNDKAPRLDPYDEFVYPNYCYPQSHPDRLGTLATLFGMNPAPVESCKVLELACGDGANLLPLALGNPGSVFVGIDRASEAVARGIRTAAALNLGNLTLKECDILAMPRSLGQFDYIIAHGLFSWVPAEVQQRILEICRSSLAPHGVAYISYNVYPGCYLRQIPRELMLFHVRELTDPSERLAQGKALIRWLSETQTGDSAYSVLLRQVNDAFLKKNEGAIYHDDLAEINTPLFFHQFVTQAARHGLQFLSESEYFYSPEHIFAPEVALQLKRLEANDVISKEQYIDFLEGRSFRQTLLCRHEIKLERSMKPEIVSRFWIRAQLRPVSAEVDFKTNAAEEFRGQKDASISTSFPLAKAAMVQLGREYPHSIRFDDLVARAASLIEPGATKDVEETRLLAQVILNAYGAGVVELHLHEPTFCYSPGERPLASPLARIQAAQGPLVTSLLYNSVHFDDVIGRRLLTLLDGTRDRECLLEELVRLVEESGGVNATTAVELEQLRKTLAAQLNEKLVELGRLGFILK